MSKSNKVENKNGTNVEMLDAYKCQHMIVRKLHALTLTHTFSSSLLFLFSTFSFFGIFMFRHFYFPPKLGLPTRVSLMLHSFFIFYAKLLIKILILWHQFNRDEIKEKNRTLNFASSYKKKKKRKLSSLLYENKVSVSQILGTCL